MSALHRRVWWGARCAFVFALCWTMLSAASEAQIRPRQVQPPAGPTPGAGSWELGGGLNFARGFDLGESAAELTRNTTDGSDAFTLFVADSQVESAGGLQAQLAYYLSPRLAVEGGLRFAQPVLRIEVSGDAEEAEDVTAEETLQQYVFTGSALWHLRRPAPGRRVSPFVFGGAGYLRDLHEEQELVETGHEFHAGGGVKIWFGSARRRFGLRGDAGVAFRTGGTDPEDGFRPVPIAGASLIYLF